MISSLDTGRKLNVHKTPIYVLYTFNLHPVSRGYGILQKYLLQTYTRKTFLYFRFFCSLKSLLLTINPQLYRGASKSRYLPYVCL